MHAERTQQSLETVLAREVECTERLLNSLEAERLALVHRDMHALARSTQEKIEHIQLLENLEQQREQILGALGFGGKPTEIGSYLASLPGGTRRLRDLWQQILANTEACRTGNLTNGGILESSRQHVEQALSILRGEAGSPSLYDPKGEAATQLGQRELGKV